MARPIKPIELIVHEGKTHLSKDQIKERRDRELKIEFKDVTPPKYLSAKLKREFAEYAYKLVKIGIMTELDEDVLAMYLLSKDEYLTYNKMLRKALSEKQDLEEVERITRMQAKAFTQCQSSAKELGLTIASRVKLVVPDVPEPKQNKFTQKFGGGASG